MIIYPAIDLFDGVVVRLQATPSWLVSLRVAVLLYLGFLCAALS